MTTKKDRKKELEAELVELQNKEKEALERETATQDAREKAEEAHKAAMEARHYYTNKIRLKKCEIEGLGPLGKVEREWLLDLRAGKSVTAWIGTRTETADSKRLARLEKIGLVSSRYGGYGSRELSLTELGMARAEEESKK